jgi:hypothetical protein
VAFPGNFWSAADKITSAALLSRSARQLSFLFFIQRTLKDRPGIKACLIGPPQAPSVFSFFVDCKVDQ